MPRKKNYANSNFYNSFSVRLRETLIRKNISQSKLSNQIGKCRQTISEYCNGLATPDINTLKDICDCLDVSSDWLLGLTDISNAKSCEAQDDIALGLSNLALNRIKSSMCDHSREEYSVKNMRPLINVLSDLLEKNEFWRLLYNLSLLTSTERLHSLIPNDVLFDDLGAIDCIYNDNEAELYRASITIHFHKLLDKYIDERLLMDR